MAKQILEANRIHYAIGNRMLLDIDRLAVYDGERIGLIGENGMGKTTLLNILYGALQPDEGTVRRFGPSAMIAQHGNTDASGDAQTAALFKSRGAEMGRSGGEMTRNRIANALSHHPALLFADEPTTDLDEEGLRVLRKELEAFSGSILLISHDRSLLRALCSRIWYLEDGKITDFPGGYDDFMLERERQRERASFEYDQYRQEQKRLKESAQKMAERASQVKKAPSRMGNGEARLHKREWTDSVLQLSHAKRTIENRMEHLEVKEKPRKMPEIHMKLGVEHPVEARNVLEFQCGKMSAGGKLLLSDTGFTVPTLSHTAVIGPNGCGKTTLLRALTGLQEPGIAFEGRVRLNPAVRIGWFDQHHEKTLRREKTIMENVMEVTSFPEGTARSILACLGLRGDAVFKPVSVLSGGEIAKTALARILLMDCNTLILDEPTNHLDLFTMEELERLLREYGGTLIFVSHDEEFIRKTADRIVAFEKGKLQVFEGGLDAMRSDKKKSLTQEERQIKVSMLEMRLAATASRMAAPRKGDKPEALQSEYQSIAAQLRELKS